MAAKIELAEAIGEIRRNLIKAQAAGEGETLQFRVSAIDLELQVRITEDAKAKGGIKAWVISTDGELATSSGATHTIRLKLEPVDQRGGEFKVSGRR